MVLHTLLEGLSDYKIYGSEKIVISALTDDSRKIKKSNLFIAIKGLKVDAHKFIPDAIAKGASVIVGEVEPKNEWLRKITYIRVPNSRYALGVIASAWYGYPSRSMKVIGVTGTKGKTTVSHILFWLFKNAGLRAGLVSSINAFIGDRELDTGAHVTNPEPLSLQKLLSQMLEAKCEYAVLEITSHGLDQERVAGIDFDTAILTNIAHEHLDYHQTFENYKTAKAKLFRSVNVAILNKDDGSFEFIKGVLPQTTQLITYAIKNQADYTGGKLLLNEVMKFQVMVGSEKHEITSNLVGDYNALNILAAIAVARKLDVDWHSIEKTITDLPKLPGRFEKIENDKGISIYVDFAHTPDSLEKVLALLRKKYSGRLISVFGCASERDTLKRPMMGEISTRLADISIFTAEDPRNESVDKVISEIVGGVKKKRAEEGKPRYFHESINRSKKHIFFRIPERGEAISFAIRKLAKKGDVVAIFGKGHEKSMAYNGIEYPWSDQEAVKIALKGKVKEIKRPGL